MTLLEKLDGMDKNRMVYIGAKHGSGWIFMDTVEEVLKNLDSMDRKLYKKASRTLKDANSKLEEYPVRIVKIMEEMRNETDEKKKKRLSDALLKLQNNFSAAVKTRNQYERICFDWTPLKNRKLVEKYFHTSEPTGEAIIVEGYDRSEYCFYEELHGFNKKEDSVA